MKLREVRRFLWALAAAAVVLVIVVLRVAGAHAPASVASEAAAQAVPARQGILARLAPPVASPRKPLTSACQQDSDLPAARINGASLPTLAWSPFGRAEIGWEIYLPLIQREIGAFCSADSAAFADALAAWQRSHRLPSDGIMSQATFAIMLVDIELRRDFVRLTRDGHCPDAHPLVIETHRDEGYAGKPALMRAGTLGAYRRMVATARSEIPEIAADPRNLTIFSAYRRPDAEAARCAANGDCDGVARARCSAHRTGLAVDIYMGQAPGFGPDSAADANRLFISRGATYRWLVGNAALFGFVPYPYEPWHWEWTGEAP